MKFKTKNVFRSFIQKIKIRIFNYALKSVQNNSKVSDRLTNLYSKVGKLLGVSDHFKWSVQWRIKYANTMDDMIKGNLSDEVCFSENIVLDNGATEVLKLLIGDSTATSFNNVNARIGVGDGTSSESSSQTGLVGTNKAYKGMDGGFPKIVGSRSVTFQSTFGDTEANFAINEIVILNGTGANSVALNRKLKYLGTKASGIMTVTGTVQLLSV